MNTYQPRTIIQMSEDEKELKAALHYITQTEGNGGPQTQMVIKGASAEGRSIEEVNEAIGTAMMIDAFIAGAHSRETYICELHKERDECLNTIAELELKLKAAYTTNNDLENCLSKLQPPKSSHRLRPGDKTQYGTLSKVEGNMLFFANCIITINGVEVGIDYNSYTYPPVKID